MHPTDVVIAKNSERWPVMHVCAKSMASTMNVVILYTNLRTDEKRSSMRLTSGLIEIILREEFCESRCERTLYVQNSSDSPVERYVVA